MFEGTGKGRGELAISFRLTTAAVLLGMTPFQVLCRAQPLSVEERPALALPHTPGQAQPVPQKAPTDSVCAGIVGAAKAMCSAQGGSGGHA